MKWIEAELGDVIVLNYGFNLPEKKRLPGPFPVYGSNGVVGAHTEPLVKAAGVVVGRKGSAGSVHFSVGPFSPIDTTFFVTANDTEVDLEFLYYLLRHLDLTRILGDVGVPGLNRESAYREHVRFPSDLDDQKKIADVLRTVEAAATQQQRLVDVVGELKSVAAATLFANGMRNEERKETEIGPIPQSWTPTRVDGCCEILTGSMSYSAFIETEPFTGDDAVVCMAVKVADMNRVGNELSLVSSEEVKPLKPAVVRKKLVPPGSAVFPKRGAAIATNKKRLTTAWTVLDPNLIALHPHDELDVGFLFQWLQTFDLRTVTEPGPTPQLNKKDLAPVLLPLPPDREEQRKIASQLSVLDQKSLLHRQKGALLTEVLEALLDRLFDADGAEVEAAVAAAV
jgi:type I restriction enzyme S subunit